MVEGQGLVYVNATNDNLNLSEVLAIEEAKKFGADAIYFRKMLEKNISIPQVYIYEGSYDENDLLELHRKLWSSGVVPIFYIIHGDLIKIFSSTTRVKRIGSKFHIEPLEIFEFIAEIDEQYNSIYKRFSAELFDTGAFWQSEQNGKLIDVSNSPYQTLLIGLLNARRYLNANINKMGAISEFTISKLLIMCILIKYLDEKQDQYGNKLFDIYRDFIGVFKEVHQFTDILRYGYSISFFELLSKKFNGKVFHFDDVEKEEISNADLSYVADIFDARVKNNQYVIWQLYSFNHLPIELISGIYEAFLKKNIEDSSNRGIVYTPPYLVNLLIDECMPINKAVEYFNQESFKVLDPACGSGIFLVTALKRMIQWKAVISYIQTGKIVYPDIETVKRIIKNNIFGIDIEQDATLISIFSLVVALCEKLTPMQIWNELQFDDLSLNNIQTINFFKYFQRAQSEETFDLIIGNPPFNPPPPFNNKSYYKFLSDNFNTQSSFPLPDQNLALLFWDRAIRIAKLGKNICFILPAGAWLYNENSFAYRTNFLNTFNVSKILDFTHLSSILFHGSTNIAVCAVFARNESPSRYPILHVTIKRTTVAEKRYYFEIDHYDFHSVRHDDALFNKYVWKANLYGGGRLIQLINRMNYLQSIEKFLKGKKKRGWRYGEGYIIGKKKGAPASWITDKLSVDTDSFNDASLGNLFIETSKKFYRSASTAKEIFKAPHILIKENLVNKTIPTFFSDEDLCFKHSVIGIHAPVNDRENLIDFYERFRKYSRLYYFLINITSPRTGITFSSSVPLRSDIFNLPYPDNEEDLQLSKSETVLFYDTMEYFTKFSNAVRGNEIHRNVNFVDLTDFGIVFCEILNSIYQKENNLWQVDNYYIGESFVGYVFCYGRLKKHSIVNWSNPDGHFLNKLLKNTTYQSAKITRILRAYFHAEGYDLIIFLKPNSLRYWLKSIALRDADDSFADLKRAGF